MANLFKKAAIFTDLHVGEKSNSVIHNQDCDRYIDWFLQLAKGQGCDLIIFLGDFHHNRNSINIQTMSVSLDILEKINNSGIRAMFIPGNHDLYHKDKRSISSVKYINKFQNIQLINDIYREGDVTFIPWLVGDEHSHIKKIRDKYVMGHFELPHFKMNAMVEMPDTGLIHGSQFKDSDLVFSGHFHTRQNKGNIHYIGNAFPHNFSDAGDDARGAMILNWGGNPEFHDWPDGPRYRVISLAAVLDTPGDYLNSNTYAKVNIDIEITYEEAVFIKETLMKEWNAREINLIVNKSTDDLTTGSPDLVFESIDQIVCNQIQNLDSSSTYDKNLLMEIYTKL